MSALKLANYRDVSPQGRTMQSGFQWEFICSCCQETWRSPFKPYRIGQASGAVRRFAMVFSEFYKIGAINELAAKIDRATGSATTTTGDSKPKQAALEEALALARQRYHACPGCKGTVDDQCWNESLELCITCAEKQHTGGTDARSTDGGVVCSNCQTPSQGGRFCHECGFDMASTHKSCPTCGATMARQARFCTDCGHGF